MFVNRCTFAVDGAAMKVNEDVERVLKEFHGDKKPIGCVSMDLHYGCEWRVQ